MCLRLRAVVRETDTQTEQMQKTFTLHRWSHTHTHTHTHIYIYIYIQGFLQDFFKPWGVFARAEEGGDDDDNMNFEM